jgi:hypothetical protein
LGGAGRGREISGGRGFEDGGGGEKSEEGRRGEIYSGVRAFRVCVAEIRAGVMDLISWPFPGWWDRGRGPTGFFFLSLYPQLIHLIECRNKAQNVAFSKDCNPIF